MWSVPIAASLRLPLQSSSSPRLWLVTSSGAGNPRVLGEELGGVQRWIWWQLCTLDFILSFQSLSTPFYSLDIYHQNDWCMSKETHRQSIDLHRGKLTLKYTIKMSTYSCTLQNANLKVAVAWCELLKGAASYEKHQGGIPGTFQAP